MEKITSEEKNILIGRITTVKKVVLKKIDKDSKIITNNIINNIDNTNLINDVKLFNIFVKNCDKDINDINNNSIDDATFNALNDEYGKLILEIINDEECKEFISINTDEINNDNQEETDNKSDKKEIILNGLLIFTGVSAICALSLLAITLLKGCGKNNIITPHINDEDGITPVSEDIELEVIDVEEIASININDLINQQAELINTGEMDITKEELIDMMKFFNRSNDKSITFDEANTYVSTIVNAEVNKEITQINNLMGIENTAGYDIGNFETSSLLVEDTVAKEELEYLDAIQDKLLSDNETIRYEGAKEYIYALNNLVVEEKNYSTTATRIDDVLVNNEKHSLFTQYNSSAERVLYIIKLSAMEPLANIIAPKMKITNTVSIVSEDGTTTSVNHNYTIDKLFAELNDPICETELNMLSGYLNGAVIDANAIVTQKQSGIYDADTGIYTDEDGISYTIVK